jgi:hypothetical protein
MDPDLPKMTVDLRPEPVFVNHLGSSGIESQPGRIDSLAP